MDISLKTKKHGLVSGELVMWDGKNDDFIVDFCAKRDHTLCRIASTGQNIVTKEYYLEIEPADTMRNPSLTIFKNNIVFCKRGSDVLKVFKDIKELYEDF